MEEPGCQSIIPGLPDELASLCLAHVSHGHCGALECVSRRWRDVLRSEEHARIKARERLSGDWLFVFTDEGPSTGWRAYDPDADRWRPLPRPPESSHAGFACVALNDRLLVLGGFPARGCGHVPTSGVLSFDPYRMSWSVVAGMKTARAQFACAAVRGRVLVAGGCESALSPGIASAESYDLLRDRWEDLPPMPAPLRGCFGLSHDGRFHVIGRGADGPPQHFIFDSAEGQWEAAPPEWELHRVERCAVATLDGRVYGFLDEGLAVLEAVSGRWTVVAEPLLLETPGHSRRLPPSGAGLVGLRGRLYVVGGKAVRYNERANLFRIVKFCCARYCDPAATPIRWQEARRLYRAWGSVLGLAALHQQCP